MKLFVNATSPYARLIRVMLIETGLDAETSIVTVDPWASPDDLLAANPAAKIPALSLEDGTHLIESACIADYLIARSGKAVLSPLARVDAPRRLEMLGLGRAAMDCAFGAVIQERFAGGPALGARWLEALPRIAGRLEALMEHKAASADPAAATPDLAGLTVAAAFAYIDFRLPETPWRAAAPRLGAFLAAMEARASFAGTRPA